MEIKKYLELYQNIAYQTFYNAFTKKSFSHAYLLNGEPNTPLFEIAKFLAKSLLCKNANPFACDECILCKRVDENKYHDLFIYDASNGTAIKKEEITNLIEEFSKTVFEKDGKKIYIINNVENLNVFSINSLLKFLEEPGKEVFAILTTNNLKSLLPTVISRCQTIKINPIPRDIVINESISLGVEQFDAELLSTLYNDANIVKQQIDNPKYQYLKENIISLLNALLEDGESSFYKSYKIMLECLKDKTNVSLFLDILAKCFEDILLIQNENEPLLMQISDILSLLAKKLVNVDLSLTEILKMNKTFTLNVKPELIVHHLINTILKGEEK